MGSSVEFLVITLLACTVRQPVYSRREKETNEDTVFRLFNEHFSKTSKTGEDSGETLKLLQRTRKLLGPNNPEADSLLNNMIKNITSNRKNRKSAIFSEFKKKLNSRNSGPNAFDLLNYLTESINQINNLTDYMQQIINHMWNEFENRYTTNNMDSLECGGTYLIREKPLSFQLESPDQPCLLTFAGSRTDMCTVAISCEGNLTDSGTSTICSNPTEYFEVYDAKNGKEILCGISNFDGIPKLARNDGTDLFVKYKSSSESAICKVYCTEDEPQDDATMKTPEPLAINTDYKPNTEKDCVCGMRNNNKTDKLERVVGGTDAERFEFPWIAPVVPRLTRGVSRLPYCGASLINDRYALSAAHCFTVNGTAERAEKIQLIFHSHVMDKDKQFNWDLLASLGFKNVQNIPGWYSKDKNDRDEKSVRRNVKKIILHPKYNNITFDYDIAILQLEKKVDLKKGNVVPICLPEIGDKFRDFVDKQMTLAGWGRYLTEVEHSARTLQKLDMPIIDCDESPATKRHLCAGYPQRTRLRGACKGDSGGPLITPLDGGVHNQYILAGIVSAGKYGNCTAKGWPALYTNVQEVIEWVYHNTEDGIFCEKREADRRRVKSQGGRERDRPQIMRGSGRNVIPEELSSEENVRRQPVPPEVLMLNKDLDLDETKCNSEYLMTEKGFVTFNLDSPQRACKMSFKGSMEAGCTVAVMCKGNLSDSSNSTSCTNDNDFFEVLDATDGRDKLCGSTSFDELPKVARNNETDLVIVYKTISKSAACAVFCVEDVKNTDNTLKKLVPLSADKMVSEQV